MKTNSTSEAAISLCKKALANIQAENAEMKILPKTGDSYESGQSFSQKSVRNSHCWVPIFYGSTK